jgi:hypothetical protein
MAITVNIGRCRAQTHESREQVPASGLIEMEVQSAGNGYFMGW